MNGTSEPSDAPRPHPQTPVGPPPSHADLLDRALPAVLTTHMPDGRLQSTVVWFWRHAEEVRLSTMAQFRKARNLLEHPRATLNVTGPDGRWLSLQADVVPQPGDGTADLDAVGELYCGVRPYFGAVVPAELAQVETPTTFRLLARRVAVGSTAALTTPPAPDTAQAAPDATAGVGIPASHHDLLDGSHVATLATRTPGGDAHVRPVRCTRDGDEVLVPIGADSAPAHHLDVDPRATVLVIDPGDSSRWLEVRGDVVGRTGGAARLRPLRVNRDAVHR